MILFDNKKKKLNENVITSQKGKKNLKLNYLQIKR